MYLAEDRVSIGRYREWKWFAEVVRSLDPMLGIGLETCRFMDLALCEVCVRCYRRARWSKFPPNVMKPSSNGMCRSQNLFLSAVAGSMVHSSQQSTVHSTSTTSTAHHTRLSVNSGYTSRCSINFSTSSSRGLRWRIITFLLLSLATRWRTTVSIWRLGLQSLTGYWIIFMLVWCWCVSYLRLGTGLKVRKWDTRFLSLDLRLSQFIWRYILVLAYLFFTSTHFHLSTQVVAFLLAFKSIDALSNELQRSLTFGDIFTNRIFFNVILSMAATLGLYFVSSFLFVRVVWCFDIGWTDERLSFSSNPGICLHPLSNTYCWHHHTLTC